MSIEQTEKTAEVAADIYEAILGIIRDVPYVPKDIHIQGASADYKAVSAANIMDKTRELMVRAGIIMYPTNYEISREGTTTTVNVKYVFCHVPSQTSIVVAAVGQGTDKFDKGAGKAGTYADKYAVMRLFRIVTGDDPDRVGNDNHEKEYGELEVKYKELSQTLGDLKLDNVIGKDYFENAKDALDRYYKAKDFHGMNEAEKVIKGLVK